MAVNLFRLRSAALVLALSACLQSCDRSDDGPIRVAVIGEDRPLADPSKEALAPGQALLLSNSAQGLVRFDARGQIVPGLAERWTVTDDGMSFIFRLSPDEWPDGRKVTAEEVARILRRQIASKSRNELKDSVGAIDEIVAMTDRVIEIRLKAPRPNLLQLLAQPEFALLRDGGGTGPFEAADIDDDNESGVRLTRSELDDDDEEVRREEVLVASQEAPAAVKGFAAKDIDLVVGGSFVDLPYARAEGVPSGALQFDPAIGLFGLVPVAEDGILADVEVRRLLNQAIDRGALIEALGVPGLLPRTTLLEPRLDPMPDPVPPPWSQTPIAERRPALVAAAERLFADSEEPPVIRIDLPDGPGAQVLLARLSADWAPLGLTVERAERPAKADLRLIDQVAPSLSAAWFLRRFRCAEAAICEPDADELLESARGAPVIAQRIALLGDAARTMDEAQLFIPIAAPIRWSLVGPRVRGFAGNRFARHTLIGLGEPLARDRAE